MTQATQVTATRVLKPWRLALQALSFVLLVLTLMAIATRGPLADETDEAATFVRGFGDHALATLSDPTLDEEARSREFRRLLTDGFHLDLIGRFVLGRYWRRASKEQKNDYIRLFGQFIAKNYSTKLGGYSGEKLKILNEKPH